MTTTPEGLPAWLHVGAEVAEVRYATGGATIRETTIVRFTNTQAVLDDTAGTRYSLRHVTEHHDRIRGRGDWSLIPRNGDEYRDAAQSIRDARLSSAARRAVTAWERRPSDETARAAITALEATLTTTETPS